MAGGRGGGKRGAQPTPMFATPVGNPNTVQLASELPVKQQKKVKWSP